jgi:twitching motility protein PilI
MANREALRELQTRLASRLQAAKTQGLSVSWLAVRSGGGNFLFPLAQSGEIFPLAGLQVVPYVQPWFCGVVNLRGGLYGVVDLAAFLQDPAGGALPKPAAMVPGAPAPSVITLNAALEVNCALLVDALAGLRNAEAFADATPAPEGSPEYFGNRYTEPGGDHWQEINLQALSRLPRFLSISA